MATANRFWPTSRTTRVLVGLAAVAAVTAGGLVLSGGGEPPGAVSAVARHGDVVVTLVESGVLRPAASTTYRSPLIGREAELIFLAPEGMLVGPGDLLARLDTTELAQELDRAQNVLRQAEIGAAVAVAEREDVKAELESILVGERALAVEEAQAKLQITERRVARLRDEYTGLKPLFTKGFITKDEFDRAGQELEQAEIDAGLLRKRVGLLGDKARPREEARARLQLAQREAQVANTLRQQREVAALAASLREAIEACSLYAKHGGLVVHEEFLAAHPRRRVRVGDRVTAAQGLVTIPDVDRMLLDTSVRESDLWRLKVGQAVTVSVEAFPALKLTGRLAAIGVLGRNPIDRPFEEKRFDVSVTLDGTQRDLRPDMTGHARIVVAERRSVVVVPLAAVSRHGDKWIVTVLGRLRAEVRRVTVGESDETSIEIVSGLADGDRVSLAGSLGGRVDR